MSKKRKLNYISLMWEELPEKVIFYIIPREALDKGDAKMLKACHLNYINSGGVNTSFAKREVVERSLWRLKARITDPDNGCLTENYRNEEAYNCELSREDYDSILGKWFKYKLDTESPRTLPRSKLFCSGYLN